MLEHTFQCPLPRGIHARPASHLQSLAKRYRSKIHLVNLSNGKTANVRSIFSLVGAEIRSEDRCRLSVNGPDQVEALSGLRGYIETDFLTCDISPDEPVRRANEGVLPQSLLAVQPHFLSGRAVVAGLGQAPLRLENRSSLPERLQMAKGSTGSEHRLFVRACQALSQQLLARMQLAHVLDERGILQAHHGLVTDEEFGEQVRHAIEEEGVGAGEAVLKVVRGYRRQFQASDNELTRNKVLDLDDLCRCLLVHMYGIKELGSRTIDLADPCILVAPFLTPGEFLELDREKLEGLVLTDAGTTSHTVILARAHDIPTLTGIKFTALMPHAGEPVVLDAYLGLLILSPVPGVEAYYDLEKKKQATLRRKIAPWAHQPARSRDGVILEVSANITCAAAARPAFAAGAAGIGLFRTEMLYLDRDQPPGEEEQLLAYRTVLEEAGSRRVLLRTFDVGADKSPAYLDLHVEGDLDVEQRGVGLYRRHEALFRLQLRAMLRAAPAGNPWITIPMVSSVEEVLWVRSLIEEIVGDLRAQGVVFGRPVPLGAMIETPAAAQGVAQLCEHLEFFSIGTNDLTQYLLAIDRTHGFGPDLCGAHQPKLIALLAEVAQAIRAQGKWVGLCGEMATDPVNIPLWLGMGLNGISVPSATIARIKSAISEVSAGEAKNKMAALVACQTAEAVTEKLQAIGRRLPRVLPVIDPHMILLDVKISSKPLILKALADHLLVAERVTDSILVENALWEREKTYSTGLGFGLAIPHCTSPAVTANTIAVMRLAQPVSWGSIDDKPVSTVILLAHSEAGGDDYLKVFARLSRLLMREAFRKALHSDASPEALADLFKRELAL